MELPPTWYLGGGNGIGNDGSVRTSKPKSDGSGCVLPIFFNPVQPVSQDEDCDAIMYKSIALENCNSYQHAMFWPFLTEPCLVMCIRSYKV